MTEKRKWEYTLEDIAKVAMRSIHSVRDDKQNGVFDPASFRSVCLYVASWIIRKRAKK